MRIYFVVYLLMIRVAELRETSPKEVHEDGCEEFSISAEDLRDPSKLSEIRKFLYKAFERNGGSGLEITTTILTNDDDINTPTWEPSTGTTSAKVNDVVENHSSHEFLHKTLEPTTTISTNNDGISNPISEQHMFTKSTDAVENHSSDNAISPTMRCNLPGSSAYSTFGHAETTKISEHCNYSTGNSYIWTEVHNKCDVTYKKAEEICTENNSVVAIIQDEAAFDNVVACVRAKVPADMTCIGIWTGWRTNSSVSNLDSNNALQKWAEDESFPVSELSYVFIRVCRTPGVKTAGMRNGHSEDKGKHGVVCQRHT